MTATMTSQVVIDALIEKAERQEREIKRLAELARYAQHTQWCDAHPVHSGRGPCQCGYEKARSAG